jgi:hypothetical protein
MAIIMIAINTASFIFSPATSLGQGGLYRYRCYAYILWVVFLSLWLASHSSTLKEPLYRKEASVIFKYGLSGTD